ncbi:MAG TPA: GAF domain-containing sensor histidine kinase [Ktedonosporobacter sp.]|nr:GAF domain-containing sensor histidine kinase [Ktedonosporobacter sp.]
MTAQTERQQLEEQLRQSKQREQRAHDALNALLTMAESLVLKPDETDLSDLVNSPTTDEAARQLARLTCKVLECRSVGILALDPSTDMLIPVAVAGITTEHKQQWWATQQQQRYTLHSSFPSEQVMKLHANEVLLLDMQQPQLHNLLAPYQVRVMLVAPMQVSEQLIGLLVLDFDEVEHEHSREEIALARTVAKLVALVIEHKRLFFERATAQVGEIAQRAAKQRMEEFLGIASHELRSPLTTINVNIQVAERLLRKMLSQCPDDMNDLQNTGGAIQEMLSSAGRQVQMLSRLVGDLIDISRIQANKLELHMRQQPCDLAVIVQEAVQNQRHVAPARDIRLAMSLPHRADVPSPIGSEDTLIPIFADADRIGQVMTNYLTNAIKYSATDRPIEIRLLVEGGQAQVTVRDEGPGLSLTEQQHIWERFYQAADTEQQSTDAGVGLGLGLHISRSIIERHQGRVGVQSTPGKGSTFWFTLPLNNQGC